MTDNEAIRELIYSIDELLVGKSTSRLESLTNADFESEDIKNLCISVNKLIEQYIDGCTYANALVKGQLNNITPESPLFINPLQELHNSLKQIIWQTNSISKGDYDQRFEYMGEISESFNRLIEHLKSEQNQQKEFLEKEYQHILIAENSHDVIAVLGLDNLKLKYISPSIKFLLNYTADEALQLSLEEIFQAEAYKKLINNIHAALFDNASTIETVQTNEYRLISKEKETLYVEIYSNIIKDNCNKPYEVLCVIRNINQRKKAELAVKESEAKLVKLLARQTEKNSKLTRNLNYIFENTVDAIAFFDIIDDQIYFSICNTRWSNALGINKEEIIGMNINQLPDSETVTLYKKYIQWAISEDKPIEDVTHWRDRELKLTVIPIKDNTNKIIGCAGFVNDITEQQTAIQKMRDLERQLAYTGIAVETRERKKLSADLHDNVGPLLSSMNMYISSLSRKPELQAHSEAINNIRRILKETIASVREISNNISPQVLTSFGLTAALDLFFETKKDIIRVNINNNMGPFRFNETKETMLYNIIKEAFNNSIKYANATCIELEINKVDNLLIVIYKDNGIGFNLQEKLAQVSQSLGLFSIINRIKNLNGIYEITTSPGKGFKLEVNFLTDN